MAMLDPTELRLYKSGSENPDERRREVVRPGRGLPPGGRQLGAAAGRGRDPAGPARPLEPRVEAGGGAESRRASARGRARGRLDAEVAVRARAPGGERGAARGAEAAVKRYETFLEIAGGSAWPRPGGATVAPRTPDLEVQVGAGREAGRAHVADARRPGRRTAPLPRGSGSGGRTTRSRHRRARSPTRLP